MKRYIFYFITLFLLLSLSITTLIYQTQPTEFIPTDSAGNSFTIRGSADCEVITVYRQQDSEEVLNYLFESNAKDNLLEHNDILSAQGQKVGQRGVVLLKPNQEARIFWTEGKYFWIIDAPTLELALEFEKSEFMPQIKAYKTFTHKPCKRKYNDVIESKEDWDRLGL
jgi:hypothetical protein